MNYLILSLLFFLSGFFMKLSDDIYDVNHDLKISTIFSIFCAITCAIATISDAGAVYIFIAILIGNLLAFKVDGPHHLLCLIIFVVICLISGLPNINIVILLICIIGALVDEIGHETISILTKDRFLNLFFEYRCFMKIIILLLTVINIFSVYLLISFILFELSYLLGGVVFKNLN